MALRNGKTVMTTTARHGTAALACYAAARALTVNEAAAADTIAADLQACRARGDTAAVRGATAALRQAVLRLATVDAASVPDLERQVAALARNLPVLTPAWLVRPMVRNAVTLACYRLDVSADTQAMLKAMLPMAETDVAG